MNAEEMWVELLSKKQNYPMANLNIKSTWDSKKGITLKVQGAKKLLTISLKSHSKSTNGFRFKLGKTHKDSVRFSRIYKYPKNLPVRKGALDIVLKIRPAIWSIYLNNQRVVDFPELFSDAYA
ncbi:MAG: hypothetical protein HRT89_06440, partial [Lentisphaeria bacterium]|nr:hypothetical protein [Lentisphaeria bacterium]